MNGINRKKQKSREENIEDVPIELEEDFQIFKS